VIFSKHQRLRIKTYEELLGDKYFTEEIIAGKKDICFIAIHPFADDLDILSSIGSTPNDCIRVDAYLKYHNDIYFIQIEGSGYSNLRNEGMYVRRTNDERLQENFLVILRDNLVTRSLFYGVIIDITGYIDDGNYRTMITSHLVKL